MKRLSTIPLTVVIGIACLLSGCQTTTKVAQKIGIGKKEPVPTNFYLNDTEMLSVRRVVMMPVHAPQVGLSSELEIDNQFRAKLTATQLFEVVTISRENLVRRFGQRSFSSAIPLDDALFDYLKEATDADAVIFFDLTSYQPFRPIKIGVRGKIIKLPQKTVLWAVDELYDASNRTTTKEAIKYEKKYLSKMETTKQYNSILISPIRFTAFAAEKCVLSLPENSLSRNF